MLPRRRKSFYGLLDTPRLRDGVGLQRKLRKMLPRRRMSFYGLLDAPRRRGRVGYKRHLEAMLPRRRVSIYGLLDAPGRERGGGVPRGSSRTLGDPPLGVSLSAEEVLPRTSRRSRGIWEGEGSRRSEIMNASNNDYWVLFLVIP